MAELKRVPTTEQKPTPVAVSKSAAEPKAGTQPKVAAEPKAAMEPRKAPISEESRIEVAMHEQTQILKDMLQKLKEIRRRLPPPSASPAKVKAKAGAKPMRIKANSKR